MDRIRDPGRRHNNGFSKLGSLGHRALKLFNFTMKSVHFGTFQYIPGRLSVRAVSCCIVLQ